MDGYAQGDPAALSYALNDMPSRTLADNLDESL